MAIGSAQQPASSVPPSATGRIVGRILDASTGRGVSEVGVQIVGTTLGGMSGVEGRYAVPNIPAGTVPIQVRRIGYAPRTITGILLSAGQSLEQNIALRPTTVQLQGVQTTAAAGRGSVNEALDQQRTAAGIVSSVTAGPRKTPGRLNRGPSGTGALPARSKSVTKLG